MNQTSPTVKIGTSRQVVIPKNIHDLLGLAPGDYLQVDVQAGKVVFTPKALVDKELAKGLTEGLEDIRHGRTAGPFRSTKAMVRALHRKSFPRKK